MHRVRDLLGRWKDPKDRAWFAGYMRVVAKFDNNVEAKIPLLEATPNYRAEAEATIVGGQVNRA